jgi:hypothetical protein
MTTYSTRATLLCYVASNAALALVCIYTFGEVDGMKAYLLIILTTLIIHFDRKFHP